MPHHHKKNHSTPVAINTVIDGKKLKPTACLTFDSTKFDATFMAKLEEILYGTEPTTEGGTDGVDARLPLPDEILKLYQEFQTAG